MMKNNTRKTTAALAAAAMMITSGLSGCGRKAAAAAVNTESSAPIGTTVPSESAAAGIVTDSTLVWVDAPGSVDIDDYYDLGGSPYWAYDEFETHVEETGYEVNWGDPKRLRDGVLVNTGNALELEQNPQYETQRFAYPSDAIGVKKNDKTGIFNFEGQQLVEPIYENISYNTLANLLTSDEHGEQYELGNNEIRFLENFEAQDTHMPEGYGADSMQMYIYNGQIVDWNNNPDSLLPDANIIFKVCSDAEHQNVIGYTLVKTDGSWVDIPADSYIPAFAYLDNKRAEWYANAPAVPENATSDQLSQFYDEQDAYYQQFDTDHKREISSFDTECYVNGVIKMTDGTNVRLLNANTMSYISNDSYQDATYFEEGICGVEKDGKWAFIDMNGNQLTDYLFDKVSPVYGGKAYVTQDGQIGILDLAGSFQQAGVQYAAPAAESLASVSDTLTVLVDRLNIRTAPSRSADSVGHVQQGTTYPYYETAQADGYTWYEIGDNQWIADQNGQYVRVH